MSKTRDNTPELDYFELRRRHEEYKRARNAPQQEKISMEERLERQAARRKVQPEAADEVSQAEVLQDEAIAGSEAAPVDAFEEAIEENYEAYDDDMDYDAEEEPSNPNPFDSFIRFFSGMKSNMSSRRRKGDELEDLDLEDLTEEELAELEAEGLIDLDEDAPVEEAAPAPAKPRFSLRKNIQEDVEEEEIESAPAEDIVDIDDDPRPARKIFSRPATDVSDFEDPDEDEEAFDEDDYADEDYDEVDELPRKSGFKKFVNLFVTRIDEDEMYEDEEFDEDEDEYVEEPDDGDLDEVEIEEVEEIEEKPARRGFFSRVRKNKALPAVDDEDIYDDLVSGDQASSEGGQGNMDEMNKPAPEAVQTAAEGNGTTGMSRRERRELAMRLAAEEAARKAEEEALAKAEAAQEEPKDAPVDMAAFENAPETDIIVETTAEEVIETVEEPTREFKPVTMRDVQAAADKAALDEDDEDEDDEEEEIVKKPRRGLFGRRRAKVEEEDEDDEDDFDEEDDFDDDDDFDDEDEDDEEEEIVKKPRRGLFGRKRAKVEEEDDEDDLDDDDDFDDEDDDEYDDDEDDFDDDEYDEYEDDEEDEDDYDDDDDDEYDDEDEDYDDDDDEPRRSFGHHLIGALKVILGIVLVLLVLVIGLNFHYFLTGENAVITNVHEMLGDSSASDVLCFGYVMRESMPAAQPAASEPVIASIPDPTALPQQESSAVIPDLNNNGAITESPVVESAPVIESAPVVQQAPAAGSIG